MSLTPSRYDDEIVISWAELHRDARYLSELLHAMGEWKGIIAITRGGFGVPAALIARELEIRLIDTICIASYGAGGTGGAEQQQGTLTVLKGVAGDGAGFLLVDDLVDTGKTAQVARRMLPKAHFATLYAKPAGRPVVDTCVKEFKRKTNGSVFRTTWDIRLSASPGRSRTARAGQQRARCLTDCAPGWTLRWRATTFPRILIGTTTVFGTATPFSTAGRKKSQFPTSSVNCWASTAEIGVCTRTTSTLFHWRQFPARPKPRPSPRSW